MATNKNEIRVYTGLKPSQHAVLKQLSDRKGISMRSLLRMIMLEAAAKEGLDPQEYAYLDDKEDTDA